MSSVASWLAGEPEVAGTTPDYQTSCNNELILNITGAQLYMRAQLIIISGGPSIQVKVHNINPLSINLDCIMFMPLLIMGTRTYWDVTDFRLTLET